MIFGELYGYLNPTVFVHYEKIPIHYKVFDIIDMDTLSFLSRRRIESLCSQYGLDIVECYTDKLSNDNLEDWINKANEVYNNRLGEGFVVKYHDGYDRYFGKLKAEEVKIKSWEESKRTIPTNIIKDAIRKVKENSPPNLTIKEFTRLVMEELKEDIIHDVQLTRSKGKIRRLVEKEFDVSDIELENRIMEHLKKLRNVMDITDTKAVMRVLGRNYKINAKKLYKVYQKCLRELTS